MPTELYRLPSSDRNTAVGVFFAAIAAVSAVIMSAIWMTTEWTAWKLWCRPELGAPLAFVPRLAQVALRYVAGIVVVSSLWMLCRKHTRNVGWILGGFAVVLAIVAIVPVYSPFGFFVWWWRFGDVPGTHDVWLTGAWMIGLPSHFAFVAAIKVAIRRARKIGGKTDIHGSARWATPEEVRSSGLLGNQDGVYVGAWEDEKGRVHYLRHDGPQNVLCFAPSRSGKGVGLVIPTLLSWRHSVVVNDIKGENWALTAGWRSREVGSICLKFDPTSRSGDSARYNPLLEVRPWPEDVRDAQNIADILVDPDGDKVRDHWDLTAHDLLVGVILHVLYAEPDKSLAGCLRLLADPSRTIDACLEAMLASEHDRGGLIGWRDASGEPTRTHPVVAGAARAVLNKSENERSSVISSAIKFLNLYRDPTVAANTAVSDFAVSDLVTSERPVSLYLAVPPSDIDRTRPLVRLVLNQIGRRLTESLAAPGVGTEASGRRRLLLMLDEFPSLGRLPFFESALAYLPGYGIKAFLIAQDLAQLYSAYGHDEAIVSNCHVRIAFAPNRIETARLLSDMAGSMTVYRETRSYTGNRLAPFLFHVIASEQESQRPLLTADEALRLPTEAALIFAAGLAPILGRKIRFFEDPIFLSRSSFQEPEKERSMPRRTWCRDAGPNSLVQGEAHPRVEIL